MKHSTTKFVTGILVGLLTTSCGQSAKPAADQPIVFAVQKVGVPFIAQARGEFEKRLKAQHIGPVKWVEFPSGPPAIEAMRAGAVDIALVGDTPVVYAQASNTDLYYVASQSLAGLVGIGLVVPGRSPAHSLGDLRGKKIAFAKGSASEYAIASSLARIGMTLADIQPVNLAPGDAQSALANGSIDAWMTWDPYLTIAELRGGGREIALPPSNVRTVLLYVAAGAFARNRPEVLSATLDELRREARWGNANRVFYRDAMARATRLPPPVLDGMLARYKDTLFQVEPIKPEDIVSQQQVSDFFYRAKMIPVKVDAAKAAWTAWHPRE